MVVFSSLVVASVKKWVVVDKVAHSENPGLCTGLLVRSRAKTRYPDTFPYHRFGLYHVDFDSNEKTQTAKTCLSSYAEIIQNNGFPIETSLDSGGLTPTVITWTEPTNAASVFAQDRVLPASTVPSQASMSVWQVRTDLLAEVFSNGGLVLYCSEIVIGIELHRLMTLQMDVVFKNNYSEEVRSK